MIPRDALIAALADMYGKRLGAGLIDLNIVKGAPRRYYAIINGNLVSKNARSTRAVKALGNGNTINTALAALWRELPPSMKTGTYSNDSGTGPLSLKQLQTLVGLHITT